MDDQDNEVEQVLRRFRPAGVPVSLRGRVLWQVSIRDTPPQRMWAAWGFRAAVAAALIVSVCLNFAADRVGTSTAASIGVGPVIWTEDAEEAARMLDGNDWGRRYIALCLMGSTGRGSFPPDISQIMRQMQ